MFDVLELLNSTVIHASPDSFFSRVLHGGVTATGNYNVTAALRDDLVLRDHRCRHARARLRSALEEHGAEGLPVADLTSC